MSKTYKIGLISDTHGHLPPAVKTVFTDMNAIIHAGDIGSSSVIRRLEELAPVTAVRGNCDLGLAAAFFEDMEIIDFAGIQIAVMHKRGQAKPLIKRGFKGIVVFGHTHNPDEFEQNGIIFINPGSASQPRLFEHGTVAVLELTENLPPKVTFLEIELP